jgi:hypothetical protein
MQHKTCGAQILDLTLHAKAVLHGLLLQGASLSAVMKLSDMNPEAWAFSHLVDHGIVRITAKLRHTSVVK